MPLKFGSDSKTKASNVHELMHAYMQKGSIGTSHPKDKRAAIKQAVAIAYARARERK